MHSGWYPDDHFTGFERYWNGREWTRNVRPAGARWRRPTPRGFWASVAYVTGRNAGFTYWGPARYTADFESSVPPLERAAAAEAHQPRMALLVVRAWQTRRNQGSTSDFVRRHATAALNFQITATIAWGLCCVAFVIAAMAVSNGWHEGGVWVFLASVVAVAAGLYPTGLSCQAAVRALAGEEWTYPFSIRFFR